MPGVRTRGSGPKKAPKAKKKPAIAVGRGVCPASGMRCRRGKIAPHYLELFVAKNGALWGYCRLHNTRTFINDRDIIAEYVTQPAEEEEPDGRS